MVVETGPEAHGWADGVFKPKGKWDNFPVYKSESAVIYWYQSNWAIVPLEQWDKLTTQEKKEGRGCMFHTATNGILPLSETRWATKPWHFGIDGAFVKKNITVRARTVRDVEEEMRSALRQQEEASRQAERLAKQRSEADALLARQAGVLAGF